MTGMVAGLGMIASGAGFISPFGAFLNGIVAGAACFYSIRLIKLILTIDDALDVFPVHGVSGILGALFTAVFADTRFGGIGIVNESGIAGQILIQCAGIASTLAWSALASFTLFKMIEKTSGIRVTQEDEISGLDISQHDQQGYNL